MKGKRSASTISAQPALKESAATVSKVVRLAPQCGQMFAVLATFSPHVLHSVRGPPRRTLFRALPGRVRLDVDLVV